MRGVKENIKKAAEQRKSNMGQPKAYSVVDSPGRKLICSVDKSIVHIHTCLYTHVHATEISLLLRHNEIITDLLA